MAVSRKPKKKQLPDESKLEAFLNKADNVTKADLEVKKDEGQGSDSGNSESKIVRTSIALSEANYNFSDTVSFQLRQDVGIKKIKPSTVHNKLMELLRLEYEAKGDESAIYKKLVKAFSE